MRLMRWIKSLFERPKCNVAECEKPMAGIAFRVKASGLKIGGTAFTTVTEPVELCAQHLEEFLDEDQDR